MSGQGDPSSAAAAIPAQGIVTVGEGGAIYSAQAVVNPVIASVVVVRAVEDELRVDQPVHVIVAQHHVTPVETQQRHIPQIDDAVCIAVDLIAIVVEIVKRSVKERSEGDAQDSVDDGSTCVGVPSHGNYRAIPDDGCGTIGTCGRRQRTTPVVVDVVIVEVVAVVVVAVIKVIVGIVAVMATTRSVAVPRSAAVSRPATITGPTVAPRLVAIVTRVDVTGLATVTRLATVVTRVDVTRLAAVSRLASIAGLTAVVAVTDAATVNLGLGAGGCMGSLGLVHIRLDTASAYRSASAAVVVAADSRVAATGCSTTAAAGIAAATVHLRCGGHAAA